MPKDRVMGVAGDVSPLRKLLILQHKYGFLLQDQRVPYGRATN